MFLSIDNPIITEDSTFLDRLGLGAQTLLLGMIVVFAMLAVIYIIMMIMQTIFTRKAKNKSSAAKPVVRESVPSAPLHADVPVSPAEESVDQTAVVAAIIAAISAYTGEVPSSFRVVSFKKR